jgi:hypothetical protein
MIVRARLLLVRSADRTEHFGYLSFQVENVDKIYFVEERLEEVHKFFHVCARDDGSAFNKR